MTRRLLAVLAVLTAVPWTARAEELPSMGSEVEWNYIDLARYNINTKKFAPVEEKTPASKIFRTAVNAPQHDIPLFNVSADNGKRSTTLAVVEKFKGKALALDDGGAAIDPTNAGANSTDNAENRKFIDYLDGTLEVATG